MTHFRATLPVNQQWLTDRIKKFHYKLEDGGACFGVALMGLQAILLHDLDTFDKRLVAINHFPLDMIDDGGKYTHHSRNKNKKYKKQQLRSTELREMKSFFDGVVLYQECKSYPEFFPQDKVPTFQDIQATAALVMPNALVKKGGLSCVNEFLGIYSKADLIDYFSSLDDAIRQANPLLTEPVGMILQSYNHAISIGYDPIEKHWMYINANHLPTQYITDVTKLAEKVLSGFSENNATVFLSRLYSTEQDKDALTRVVSQWKESGKWKKIHTVSPEKTVMVDSDNVSLFYMAAHYDFNDIVKKLLMINDTNVNIKYADDNVAVLYWAVMQNNIDLVRILLKRKDIDVNQVGGETGANALYFAAQEGYLDCIKELIKHSKLDPNQARTSDRVTPLYIAAQKGHLDVVKLLLKLPNIQVNKPCIDPDDTPYKTAIEFGHTEIANLIKDYNRDHKKIKKHIYANVNTLFRESENNIPVKKPVAFISFKK